MDNFKPAKITNEQVKSEFLKFYVEYNGKIQLESVIIRNTPEELYGQDFAIRAGLENESKPVIFCGGYLPASRSIHLFSSAFRDEKAVRRTIAHELLGHYGINTYTATEKRNLLERISAAREELSMQAIWKDVDLLYAQKSELYKAEEVFCFVAEHEHKFTSEEANNSSALHTLSLLTLRDLALETYKVSVGIQSGIRAQKIFPESNDNQFHLLNAENVTQETENHPSPLLTVETLYQQSASLLSAMKQSSESVHIQQSNHDELSMNEPEQ